MGQAGVEARCARQHGQNVEEKPSLGSRKGSWTVFLRDVGTLF